MNTMPQNIECFVTLPDSVLYNITLSLDATGYDCLLKVKYGEAVKIIIYNLHMFIES